MTPTAKAPNPPQPVVNDISGPATIAAPNLVENIPVHAPGQPPLQRDDDAELDQIMQDVGNDLHKIDMRQKKHHFWEIKPHHKKEANFSTQMSIKNAPQAASPRPQPAPVTTHPVAAPKPVTSTVQAAHTRVKPAAQKPAKAAKQPKPPKEPKQHHAPVMVTLITVLVTAALIAAAYGAYQ